MISTRLGLRSLAVLLALGPLFVPLVGSSPAALQGPSASAARVHVIDAVQSHRPQLPLGGRKILGHYRVVTYYGAPGGGALGILGSKPPARIAADIKQRAKQWRGYGLRVQPAMELIATVAQGSPGPHGDYSAPISHAAVRRYLTVAHRDHLLLILDFQPGHANFIEQVRSFAPFLRDPSVSVALDPEWKMHGHEVPAQVIGHTSASAVNAVGAYLRGIVRKYNLPDKLLIVHQFTTQMIRHRSKITTGHGIEVVFHADGFGSPAAKRATWHRLQFPRRPYGAGFKLFTKQDTPMMTPKQVMKLRPKVDLISYQ